MNITIPCPPYIAFHFDRQVYAFKEGEQITAEVSPLLHPEQASIFPLELREPIPDEIKPSPIGSIQWLLKSGYSPKVVDGKIVFKQVSTQFTSFREIEKVRPVKALSYCEKVKEWLLSIQATEEDLDSIQDVQDALEQHDYAEATKWTEDILYRHPDDERLSALLAHTFLLRQKPDEAYPLFRHIATNKPPVSEHDKKEVLGYWEEALHCAPKTPTLYEEIEPYCLDTISKVRLFVFGYLQLHPSTPQSACSFVERARLIDSTSFLPLIARLGHLSVDSVEALNLRRELSLLLPNQMGQEMEQSIQSVRQKGVALEEALKESILNKDLIDSNLPLELGALYESLEMFSDAERIYRVAHERFAHFESSFKLARLFCQKKSSLAEGVNLLFSLSSKSFRFLEMQKVSRCLEEIRRVDPSHQFLSAAKQAELSIHEDKVLFFEKIRKSQERKNELTPFTFPVLVEEPEFFPKHTILFGKEEWASEWGDVGDVPPPPKNWIVKKDEPNPFWPDEKIYQTTMLFLFPEKVKRKSLTPRYFQELIQASQNGRKLKFRFISERVLAEYGDVPNPKSFWGLITTRLIPGTRNKPFSKQVEIVTQHRHWRVPDFFPATICLTGNYVKTGTHLLGIDPYLFTRCHEISSIGQQVIVGGADKEKGPVIDDFDYCNSLEFGSLGFLKFSTSEKKSNE